MSLIDLKRDLHKISKIVVYEKDDEAEDRIAQLKKFILDIRCSTKDVLGACRADSEVWSVFSEDLIYKIDKELF